MVVTRNETKSRQLTQQDQQKIEIEEHTQQFLDYLSNLDLAIASHIPPAFAKTPSMAFLRFNTHKHRIEPFFNFMHTNDYFGLEIGRSLIINVSDCKK